MTAGLSRIVGDVREGSDSIAVGTAQIATGNADPRPAHRGAGQQPAADGRHDGSS